MNFLAHLYLSGNDEPLMVGNFIADHIRGYDWKTFPPQIQNGILLHRFIDEYTDSHPVVEQSKALMRNTFHKYTPVICDIYFDHFLAAEWNKFSDEALSDYSKRIYIVLHKYQQFLPERTEHMLGYMEKEDWLKHYATLGGLHKALSGMGRRASFANNMNEAASFLEKNYTSFKQHFDLFFPDLQNAVGKKRKESES